MPDSSSIEGQGDLNFRLFGDTVRLIANAYVKNLNPTFYYRHFHSKHYWWDNNDLSKIMRTRIEGKLNIDRWRTQLQSRSRKHQRTILIWTILPSK